MRLPASRLLPAALPAVLPAVLAVLLLALPAGADELTSLTLKDGRVVEGLVTAEDDASITLTTVAGASVRVEKAQVTERTNKKSPREEYAEKRAKLAADDLDGRYGLVRDDLYMRGQLALAKQEVDRLVQDFPEAEKVRVLRRLVDAALAAQGKPEPATKPGDQGKPAPVPAAAGRVLTPAEINLVRVYELDYGDDAGRPKGPDAKLRLVLAKDLYAALVEKHREHERVREFIGKEGQARFNRLSELEVLDLLFQVQAKELYGKVEVKAEPKTVQKFRAEVYPNYVARYFAAHFAAKVPGLTAPPAGRAATEAEAYTALVALMGAAGEGGPFIDRAKPENSLLLQWGLPAAEALHPAPAVEGWKPAFRNTRDPKFKAIVEWIESLFGDKSPDYGIDLTSPAAAPAPAPGAPAAPPAAPPAPAVPATP